MQVRVTDLVLIGHYLSCSLTFSLTNMASLESGIFPAQPRLTMELTGPPEYSRSGLSLTRSGRLCSVAVECNMLGEYEGKTSKAEVWY